MKKILIYLVVIIVLVGAGIMFYANSVVKRAVETYGSAILGVQVTLGSVSMSLFSGNLELNDLLIANPEGFTRPVAFRLGKVKIKAESVFGNIKLDRVDIIDSMIAYEVGVRGSNVGLLKQHVSDYTKSGQKEVSEEAAAGSSSAIEINDLYIQGAKVELAAGIPGLALGQELTIPAMHFEDLGKEDTSFSVGDALNKVLQQVNAELLKINYDAVKSKMDKVRDTLLDRIKGKF